MRGLKILVAGLGIAVIAAFLTLVTIIITRGGREAPVAETGQRPPTHVSWGRVMIDQPAGTRIQAVIPSGNLIVLQLYTGQPGQDERLVVLDPATGAVTGSFAFGQR